MLRLGGAAGLVPTIQAAGMTATSLPQTRVGCGLLDGKRNETTLSDMSRFYAAVDTATLLTPAQRDHLYATMSSNTGFGTDELLAMVQQERARPGISAATATWLGTGTRFALKGASYRLSCGNDPQPAVCAGAGAGTTAQIRTQAGIQRLPLRQPDGTDRIVTYTVGAWNARLCAAADTACGDAVAATTRNAYAEAMRSSVRDALLSREHPTDAPPVARFAAGDAVAGRPVTFDASGSTDDAGVAGLDWAFGDGATGRGATVQHVFAAPGSYVVELGATDTVGKTDTVRRTVVVAPAPAEAAGGDTPVTPGSGPTTAGTTPPAVTPTQALAARAASKVKRGKRVAVRVTLARAATVTVRVQRSVAGRRKGKRCVAPGKARRGKRCTRTVDVARVRRAAPADASSVAVPAARLKPGTYRLAVSVPGAAARTLQLRVTR